jgi:MFS family permease
MQGLGDSMVATSAYSIVAIEFPQQREIYIGYVQTAVGLGLLLGPVIGTIIYSFAGYEGTFYILSGVLTCSLLITTFFLPSRLNKSAKVDEVILDQNPAVRPSIQGIRPQGIAERHSIDMVALAKVSERYSRRSHILQAQVTFKIFLTNIRAMTAVVSAMFAMIFMLFYEPIFAPYVNAAYGVKETSVGFCLAIGCFTYAFGSPLVGVLCTKVERKYITCCAFIFCSISLLMTGPSRMILGITPHLAWTLVGVGALGLSVAFLFVPLLPEIIAAVAEKEGLENSPFLADKASGIYNSAYGIGNCLAPIIGGSISSAYGGLDVVKGFPFTCDIMAIASASFCLIYFCFAIIPSWIDAKKQKEKREQKLLADLAPGAVDNSLTIEFEQNQKDKLKDGK